MGAGQSNSEENCALRHFRCCQRSRRTSDDARGRRALIPHVDATKKIYVIFDGAQFEPIPSALRLQKYFVAVRIA